MPVKPFRPMTPGQRGRVDLDYSEITTAHPEKSLLTKLQKHCGRDSSGRISVRHQGGGNKQFYRMIDFRRDKDGIPARVVSIEYDPYRTAFIARLNYLDGEKRYILSPNGIKVGDPILSGETAEITSGNCLKLKNIPLGTVIHNIELRVGQGGKMVRSAGSGAQLAAKEGDYAIIRLPSGETRLVLLECRATIGQLSNTDNKNISLGKAGRSRHRGIRPTVRGVAMNPCDHPHGGGEGKAPIGRPSPMTPWGKKTLGKKTRHRRRPSDRFIISRRGAAKGALLT